MKRLLCILALGALVGAMPSLASAAFIVEATGGLASGTNFSFGGDTTAASNSIPSTAVGLTSANSLFGGNGSNPFGEPFDAATADTYVFTYTPGSDADNFSPAAGSVLGSADGSPGDGNRASGLVGGASGLYRVYITSPASGNVNALGSVITVTNDGPDLVVNPFDFNSGGSGPDSQVNGPGNAFVGGANNAWELLGEVSLTEGTSYTVSVAANTNSFVSQRTHGVLWERVPEPSSVLLTLLVAAGLASRRRVS